MQMIQAGCNNKVGKCVVNGADALGPELNQFGWDAKQRSGQGMNNRPLYLVFRRVSDGMISTDFTLDNVRLVTDCQ